MNLLNLLENRTSANKTSRKELRYETKLSGRKLRAAIHNIRVEKPIGIIGGFYTVRTLAEAERELANNRAVIKAHEATQAPLIELRDRLLDERRREYSHKPKQEVLF